MTKKKKTEDEILLPDVKIGKFVVRPWSFGKLFDISELLQSVLDKIEEKGLDKMFSGEQSIISYTTIARLFTICSNELLKVIAMTLEVDEKEIKALPISDGVKIALTIYKQNSETIKNVVTSTLAERVEENPQDQDT